MPSSQISCWIKHLTMCLWHKDKFKVVWAGCKGNKEVKACEEGLDWMLKNN